MYIRQECLLSFEDLIKFQPETKLELIFKAIDPQLTAVLRKLPEFSKFGPEPCDRESMLRSLIAKEVEGIKNYNSLIERLNTDPVFRYTCGFPVANKVPSASTYSRFISELKELDLLDSLLHDLVKQAVVMGIIDGTHIAIDSSKLESYDAATSNMEPRPSSHLTIVGPMTHHKGLIGIVLLFAPWDTQWCIGAMIMGL